MSCKGLLWIGTSVGCVLTLPLPRLEGVPQIKGRPSVSYHAHVGPIKFLSSIYCGATQLHKPELEESSISDIYQLSDEQHLNNDVNSPVDLLGGEQKLNIAGVTESDTEDYKGFTQSAEVMTGPRSLDDLSIGGGGGMGLGGRKNIWVSVPDLRGEEQVVRTQADDIHTLYGSLLRIPHEDYDAELMGTKYHRRPSKKGHIPGLNLVTKKAGAVNARLKQLMSETGPTSPQSKYATLPVLLDESPPPSQVSETSSRASTVDNESTTSSAVSDGEILGGVQQSSQRGLNESSQPPTSSQQALGVSKTSNRGSQHNQPMFISQSPPLAMLNNSVLGKSHMVISGGDGHINWSDDKPMDMKYEDICLLLWQYRQ